MRSRQDFPPNQYRLARGYRNSSPDNLRYGREHSRRAPSFEGGRQRGSERYESARRWQPPPEFGPGGREYYGYGGDEPYRESYFGGPDERYWPHGEDSRGGAWRESGAYGAGAEYGPREQEYATGQRRGRSGPKGYTRSDERIRDDVCERLYGREDLEVSDVGVEVKGGKVTLEGTVPERHMKHAIEDVVDECIGVQDIQNHIRVQHAGEAGEQGRPSAGSSRKH